MIIPLKKTFPDNDLMDLETRPESRVPFTPGINIRSV